MEARIDYVTNMPATPGQEEVLCCTRWHHNGAAIAALILLLNTIAMAWASLFIESATLWKWTTLSAIFAIALGASARGKSLT
jgi:hypothetical protein